MNSKDQINADIVRFHEKEKRLEEHPAGDEEMTALALSDTRLDRLLENLTEFNITLQNYRPNILEALLINGKSKLHHESLYGFLKEYNEIQPYYLKTIESNDADMKKAKTMGQIMSENKTSIRWRESLSVRMTAVSNNLSMARLTVSEWRSTALAKLSVYIGVVALVVGLLSLR